MKTENAEKHHFGCFQAKYLHPLHSFVKYGREVFQNHHAYSSIFLYPAEIGGVYIVVATGHATAIIHDPEGKADEVLKLDIPDDAFTAAKGPQVQPLTLWWEEYEVTLPEWLQPGMVYVYSPGMHIAPKMRNPAWAGEDKHFYPAIYSVGSDDTRFVRGMHFRVTTGCTLEWRTLLETAASAEPQKASELFFNPTVPALFNPLIDLLTKDHPSAVPISKQRIAPKSDATMFILQLTNCPEFVGVWMGMKPGEAPELPPHFLGKADETASTSQKDKSE